MKCFKQTVWVLAATILVLPLACDFSPTAPFTGFDEQGSRISGIFRSEAAGGASLTTLAQSEYEGIRVYVEQDPTISTFVKSNGSFTLAGLPVGDVTLVFEKDGSVIGRLTIEDVVTNQEIRIVVSLTVSGTVELVEEQRDSAGLGECARGAGFWCQNQDGQNPNMTRSEFEGYASGVLSRFQQGNVPGFEDSTDIRAVEAAVCNTGDQLLRQLTALALNLEAGLVSEETGLVGETYGTVGEAFEAALSAAANGGSRGEVNAIKDVLDGINNNVNTEGGCEPDQEDEDDADEENGTIPAGCELVDGHKITICHKGKNTITIDISAWPAHQAHGDVCGPCQ